MRYRQVNNPVILKRTRHEQSFLNKFNKLELEGHPLEVHDCLLLKYDIFNTIDRVELGSQRRGRVCDTSK